MTKKRNATSHSRNGISQEKEGNALNCERIIIETDDYSSLMKSNYWCYIIYLLKIFNILQDRLKHAYTSQMDDRLKSFSDLLDIEGVFTHNSKRGLDYTLTETDGTRSWAESSKLELILTCLGGLACFTVNLEFLERNSEVLEGLNIFLMKEFPDIHAAYFRLSDKYHFDNFLNIVNETEQNRTEKKKS